MLCVKSAFLKGHLVLLAFGEAEVLELLWKMVCSAVCGWRLSVANTSLADVILLGIFLGRYKKNPTCFRSLDHCAPFQLPKLEVTCYPS